MNTHIVLWKWQQAGVAVPYKPEYVNVMQRMLVTHGKMDRARIICVTDDPQGIQCETFPLWSDLKDSANLSGPSLPWCHRRLKLFDPDTQTAMGIARGDRIVSLDLDTVVKGDLRPLFERRERFLGWAVRGNKHPVVFNGSFWSFHAGDLTELWREFNPKESPAEARDRGFQGSDQAWLSYRLVGRTDVAFGYRWPAFASYPREILRMHHIAKETKLVFFHGRRKPWDERVRSGSRWITRYWE